MAKTGMRTRFLWSLVTASLLVGCGTGVDEGNPQKGTALVVNKAGDDGSDGTLRWAILKSNAEAGKFRIVLTPPAGGELVIKPKAQLPAIVGPARIEGPWTGSGMPSVAVDGADWLDLTLSSRGRGIPDACPGEVSGQFGPTRSLRGAGLQVVDSRDVEITGFEVRNFCIGIMSLRSHDNFIHNMRLVGNLGAAGILITGDDGSAAGGAAEERSCLHQSRAAFDELSFVPRVLRDVSARSQATRLFGTSYAHPFGIAPMGSSAVAAFDELDPRSLRLVRSCARTH